MTCGFAALRYLLPGRKHRAASLRRLLLIQVNLHIRRI